MVVGLKLAKGEAFFCYQKERAELPGRALLCQEARMPAVAAENSGGDQLLVPRVMYP